MKTHNGYQNSWFSQRNIPLLMIFKQLKLFDVRLMCNRRRFVVNISRLRECSNQSLRFLFNFCAFTRAGWSCVFLGFICLKFFRWKALYKDIGYVLKLKVGFFLHYIPLILWPEISYLKFKADVIWYLLGS